MKPLDIAVVGSGMGGSMVAACHQDKDIVLFEKDANLGGCGATFKRGKHYFNAGATTFVGYEDNHPIKNIFKKASFTPDIKESKVAIRVMQGSKILDRTTDFEQFLSDVDVLFPNKNNAIFWNKLKSIDEKFWSLKKLFYAKHNLHAYFQSLISGIELMRIFKKDVLKSADEFIQETLGDISCEYQDFIDASLLITVQSNSKNIPLLSLALGLCYPFHKVFYANKGMGEIFQGLLKNVEAKTQEPIFKIIKKNNIFHLISNKKEYKAKNVILNSTIFDSYKLFEDKNIIKYYKKFSFYDQSAFVVYLHVKTKANLLHHYQVLLQDVIPNCISKSFFISFSDKEDEKLSHDGYSVTISSHTRASFWKNLSKEEYTVQKKITEDFIIKEFLKHIKQIEKNQIQVVFTATSKTFNNFIGRYNCGGSKMALQTILQTPTCTTPFSGLYNIGDTVFAGQGWPGVALGVQTLNKILNNIYM